MVGGSGRHSPAGRLVTPTLAVQVLAVPAVAEPVLSSWQSVPVVELMVLASTVAPAMVASSQMPAVVEVETVFPVIVAAKVPDDPSRMPFVRLAIWLPEMVMSPPTVKAARRLGCRSRRHRRWCWPVTTMPVFVPNRTMALPVEVVGTVWVMVLPVTWVPVVLLATRNVSSSMLVLSWMTMPLEGVAPARAC